MNQNGSKSQYNEPELEKGRRSGAFRFIPSTDYNE